MEAAGRQTIITCNEATTIPTAVFGLTHIYTYHTVFNNAIGIIYKRDSDNNDASARTFYLRTYDINNKIFAMTNTYVANSSAAVSSTVATKMFLNNTNLETFCFNNNTTEYGTDIGPQPGAFVITAYPVEHSSGSSAAGINYSPLRGFIGPF